MAIRPDFDIGTITLSSGSADFTTTGSALEVAKVSAGDAIITPSGHVLIIATITGQNSGTLFLPCPAAAAGTDLPLRIRFQPDGSRYQGAVRNLIDMLSSGNVEALAGLTGEAGKVPVFTGPGTMSLQDYVSDPNGQLANVANSEAVAPYVLGYDANGNLSPVLARRLFASSTVIYVSPSGSDTTGDGSSASPFKTIGKSVDYVLAKADLAGFGVTIKLADGTYPENITINGTPVGYGKVGNTYPISIQGNLTNPGNVKIGSGSGITLQAINGGIVAIGGVRYVAGDYANSADGSGSAIYVTGEVELEAHTADHFASGRFSNIYLAADYTILGGAQNHIHATEGGSIYYSGTRNITLVGTPNFTGQFAGNAFGSIFAMNTSFAGAATGRTFLVHYNGQIRTETNNRFLFPGDQPGFMQNGGVYDYAPYAVLNQASDVSLTASTEAIIPWDTVVQNQNMMWNAAGWVQPIGGNFCLHANIAFTGLTAGQYVYVIIKKNSATYKVVSKACSGGQETISLILPQEASGGLDVYQIFVRYDGSGGKVLGNPAFTWASAMQIT